VKLICKLHREWGEKIFVSNVFYTIDKEDGSVDVPDEAAQRLLQNKSKWIDPTAVVKQPAKKTGGVLVPVPEDELPPVILKNPRTGEYLSDEETRVELARAQAAADAEVAPQESVDDLKAAEALLSKSNSAGKSGLSKGEGVTSDPLAAQIGQAQAAEVDAAIQEGHPTPGDVDIEPEEAPADWPKVSMKTSKKDLEAVCVRLEADGWELDRGKGRVKDLLEAVEAAYDGMETEAA
jgi:hypothetical protein